MVVPVPDGFCIFVMLVAMRRGTGRRRRESLLGRMEAGMNDDDIESKTTRPYIPPEPGFYREAGDVDWLRTQEGVWLRSTFPFIRAGCWTRRAWGPVRSWWVWNRSVSGTSTSTAALNDVTEAEGIDPLDTYAGIAATLGK